MPLVIVFESLVSYIAVIQCNHIKIQLAKQCQQQYHAIISSCCTKIQVDRNTEIDRTLNFNWLTTQLPSMLLEYLYIISVMLYMYDYIA